jgi:hypothetical protein
MLKILKFNFSSKKNNPISKMDKGDFSKEALHMAYNGT